jgi:NTE family protein
MAADKLYLSSARLLLAMCVVATLGGCASTAMHVNTPLIYDDKGAPRAGFPSAFAPCVSETDDAVCPGSPIFVGLAISGGGSRAANYSAAVMSELDRIGILKHVNAISSVSGGSLAAAYYATRSNTSKRLNTPELFWTQAKEDLSKDFRTAFVRKLLRPDNFAKSMFGSTGRTDVMAQVFDEHLFGGLKFGDMDATGPGLLINATAINGLQGVISPALCTNRRTYAASMRGESIPFTEQFFKDCLFSSISTYPVSKAVAASAAFPGLFSSVPLARFAAMNKSDRIAPSEYLHVIDGGPSDNLGVDGILGNWAAKTLHAKKNFKSDKCLIIVVDAFSSGEVDLRNLKPDSRKVLDRFIDSNFFDSIDAMLGRRRLETLRSLNIPAPHGERGHTVSDFPLTGQTSYFHENRKISESVNPFAALGMDLFSAGSEAKIASCMVWYIGIDSLSGLVAPYWEFRKLDAPYLRDRDDEEYDEAMEEHFKTDEARNRTALWDLASRVQTDFDLVGAKNCSSKVLSDVLWTAGAYSVSADVESRKKVCKWLKDMGIETSALCSEPVRTAMRSFPIKYVDHGISGYSVECQ